jgi:hypothetical protein
VQATSALKVRIEAGGDGAVGHVGLHALASFADHLGVPQALSARIPPPGERLWAHDRGKVAVQAMVMLAGGGVCCADIEQLRANGRLFGDVCSDSTLWRTFNDSLDTETLANVLDAFGDLRRQVWARSSVTNNAEPVVLDIDASVVDIHSENKEQTAPTYNGLFGFHPMFCFADATGEALAMVLRPGNAGANTIADHLAVLDTAIDQLPDTVTAGHHLGDDPTLVARPVVVRTDSAGNTNGFVAGCRERNVGFMVIARRSEAIHSALFKIRPTHPDWVPARTQGGDLRPGAAVIELTDLVELSHLPAGTRLIVRREPLHPGAQRSLFPSDEYRYWGFYTDQPGDPVTLDVMMRGHARVEDHIRRLKACGLERFPFKAFAANQAWLAVVAMAADLVRWFQLLCLTGSLATAEPKTLRWRFFHTVARVIRHARGETLRLLDDWPDTPNIVAAYQRIAELT